MQIKIPNLKPETKVMPIQRCSAQAMQSLKEYYEHLRDDRLPDIGIGMLELLDLVDEMFQETKIFGLTSMMGLLLFAEDDVPFPWYVKISSFGIRDYHFEYLLPEEQAPWPHAFVRGEARNLADAKNYLLIAMHRSQGWKNNPELKRLLKENNITF